MDTKKLNVLVTGANGQLGCALREAAKGSRAHFIFTDVNELPGSETVYLDITNGDAVQITAGSENVDVIVNCASYTNVDMAEDEPAMAQALNAEAVASLASVARSRGAVLIHISTDYIFSGNATAPIAEDAEPDPQNVYGATKLAGEKALQDSGCRYIILRTAWLYSEYGRNFVKTMLRLTASRPEVQVVSDQTGTPTYAPDLASFIIHIIDGGYLDRTGVYNYTGEGIATWYELASETCRLAGHGCEVRPCLSSEYRTRARRPAYSVLDKSLVKKTFGIVLPDWKESLRRCVANLVKEEK